MRADIFGALKNAVEKGEPIEKAVRSFINAGYNENEVREAAQALSSGASPRAFIVKQPQPLQPQSQPSLQSQDQWPLQKQEMQGIKNNANNLIAPTYNTMPSKKELDRIKSRGPDFKLIMLISVLLILIFVLIASFLFKAQIINFLTGG